MALNVAILIVDNIEGLEEQLPHLRHSIDFIGGETTAIVFTKFNKDKIKKDLIHLSDSDDNVIIILGDTSNLATSAIAYQAIEEVMDKNISHKLTEVISDLEEKLKLSFNCAICGVRQQTLMINLCGCCLSAMICLKANGDTILQIIHTIANDGAISNNNNNNNNNNSENAFSPHCLSDEEEKKICMTLEMYNKGQQNIIMNSWKDAVHVIHNVIRSSPDAIDNEVVKTKDAHGRILAENIYSSINVPSYRTSTKHGYAVLASDGQGVRTVLAVHPTSTESSVVPGTCMRVRSGAPIPDEATAVVTIDNTKMIGSDNTRHNQYFNSDDIKYEIDVLIAPAMNDNIRIGACEVENGQLISKACTRIGPAEIGILTLCGISEVSVFQASSVGLLSIGDELEDPEKPLGSKRIYDSNRITLTTLLKENDLDSVDFGISAYELTAIIQKIQNALEKVDVLVTMGRANDNDMLKPILQEYFDANIHFGRVNIKPGKSTTFATCTVNDKKKYIMCMSANPATVPIVAHVLLLPFLNELNCNYYTSRIPTFLQACLRSKQELHPRPKFTWTALRWDATETFPRARCSKNQQKIGVLSYPRANALLMLPPRTLEVPAISAAFVQATIFVSHTPPIDE